MPAYRRYDAERWYKILFYPGAVTIMLPRLLFGIVLGILLCTIVKICLICQPMDKPIRGCRRVIIRWFYKFFTTLFQLFTNFNFVTWKRLQMQDVNHYAEWLGPRD